MAKNLGSCPFSPEDPNIIRDVALREALWSKRRTSKDEKALRRELAKHRATAERNALSPVSEDVLETYVFVTQDDTITSSETEYRGTTPNIIPRIIRNLFVK